MNNKNPVIKASSSSDECLRNVVDYLLSEVLRQKEVNRIVVAELGEVKKEVEEYKNQTRKNNITIHTLTNLINDQENSQQSHVISLQNLSQKVLENSEKMEMDKVELEMIKQKLAESKTLIHNNREALNKAYPKPGEKESGKEELKTMRLKLAQHNKMINTQTEELKQIHKCFAKISDKIEVEKIKLQMTNQKLVENEKMIQRQKKALQEACKKRKVKEVDKAQLELVKKDVAQNKNLINSQRAGLNKYHANNIEPISRLISKLVQDYRGLAKMINNQSQVMNSNTDLMAQKIAENARLLQSVSGKFHSYSDGLNKVNLRCEVLESLLKNSLGLGISRSQLNEILKQSFVSKADLDKLEHKIVGTISKPNTSGDTISEISTNNSNKKFKIVDVSDR